MGEGVFYGRAEDDRIEVIQRYIGNLGHDHFGLAFREIRNLPAGIQEPISLYCNEVKKQCDILDKRLDVTLKILVEMFGKDLTREERRTLSLLRRYSREEDGELRDYHKSIITLKKLNQLDEKTRRILGTYLEEIKTKLTNQMYSDENPPGRKIFDMFIKFTLNNWNKPLNSELLEELKTIMFFTNQLGLPSDGIRVVNANNIDPQIKIIFSEIDKATMESIREISSALEVFMRVAANQH